MNIKPIREVIFPAEPNTPESGEMEVLISLIETYENKHYAIAPSDPIEAL